MASQHRHIAKQVNPELEVVSASVEQTLAFGEQLGRLLGAGDVVALYGELGSGKTTLIQGIARGLGRDPGIVKSPTFVLMREYKGEPSLIHLDGYRLEESGAAYWLDADLMFSPHKITVIEWAQRFEGILPEARLEGHLRHLRTNRRKCLLRSFGERAEKIIGKLEAAIPREDTASAAEPREKTDASGD